jgi:chromosome segregation ATPase
MILELPKPTDGLPPDKSSRSKRRPNPFWRRLGLVAGSLAVWGGLVYGAYYYATDYIDTSIRTVQESNALHVQALSERLDAIQLEVAGVKETLADTDQVLARSDQTREALSQRISELDRQLERLEESLNTLRKSPDVAR